MGERADELGLEPTSGRSAGLGYTDQPADTTGSFMEEDITWDAGARPESYSGQTGDVTYSDVSSAPDTSTAFTPDMSADYGGTDDADATGTPDIDTTRAQIEETRSQMSETIDAIQDRLSPQNLAQQAKDTVRDATIGSAQDMVSNVTSSATDALNNAGDTAKGFGYTIVETVKQNPIPLALAGIGLGWFIMSSRKQSPDQSPRNPQMYGYRDRSGNRYTPGTSGGYGYGYAAGTGGGYGYSGQTQYTDNSQNQSGSPVDQVRDAAGQVTDQVQNATGQVTDQVQNAVGQVQDSAGQFVNQAQDQVAQLGSTAQYQAQRATSGIQQMVQENPLAVGAAALALGMVVGLVVPETQQENELMGSARDNLMDQAQQTAQQTVQKVQNVAQEAVGAAKEEAQNQNLM